VSRSDIRNSIDWEGHSRYCLNLITQPAHPKSLPQAAAVYTGLWILFKLLGFAPLPPQFGGNGIFKVPQDWEI
jgi:hypothetical protein